MSNVTMREMLEAGVHFGHQTRYWNPKMGQYIFGARNKIHIIDLEQTLPMFNDAMNFVSKIASKNGKFYLLVPSVLHSILCASKLSVLASLSLITAGWVEC